MRKAEEIKDIVEKDFVSFPDIASDVINTLLYRGKAVTRADSLLGGPTVGDCSEGGQFLRMHGVILTS